MNSHDFLQPAPVTGLSVTLNGKPTPCPAACTLAEWLAELGVSASAVATAVNGEFVPRPARASRQLQDGDAVMTFQAITGG